MYPEFILANRNLSVGIILEIYCNHLSETMRVFHAFE